MNIDICIIHQRRAKCKGGIMYNQYQHPDIIAAERYGYPHKPSPSPVCPVCKWECERYFIGEYGDIVACDVCWDGNTHFEYDVDAREYDSDGEF